MSKTQKALKLFILISSSVIFIIVFHQNVPQLNKITAKRAKVTDTEVENTNIHTPKYVLRNPHETNFSALRTPWNRNNSDIYRKTNLEASAMHNLCSGTKGPVSRRRKVLSYCVFGRKSFQRYSKNVRKVIEEAASSNMYSQWSLRVYTEGNNFPLSFIMKMKEINRNVNFCDVKNIDYFYTNITSINGMVWRFIPIADDTVDISCIRDVDSPLLVREEEAVEEWLRSTEILHVMRDHPLHLTSIMGGLWCFRNIKNRQLGKELMYDMYKNAKHRSSSREAGKGDDQNILHHVVWNELQDDVMQHDSFLCNMYDSGSRPFPTRRKKYFVGCVRPCKYFKHKCQKECRPKNHNSWRRC